MTVEILTKPFRWASYFKWKSNTHMAEKNEIIQKANKELLDRLALIANRKQAPLNSIHRLRNPFAEYREKELRRVEKDNLVCR